MKNTLQAGFVLFLPLLNVNMKIDKKQPSLQMSRVLLAILLCSFSHFWVGPVSQAQTIHSHQLPANKAKVIVTFDGDIQPCIVEKYGRVLSIVKIINGVVAVIDRADISLLQGEEGIKDVVIDSRISIPPQRRQPAESLIRPMAISDACDVIVGWNLQDAGVAASDSPPPPDPPTSTGAWSEYSVDGTGVIIAILDTGVNYTLTDLDGPQYLGGYDFVHDQPDPMDDNWHPDIGDYGHGTSMATLIIAQGEEKIKGVAPNASYFALKVLDQYGTSDASHVILALDWCVNTADPKEA